MKKDYTKLKKIFSDDPEMLRSLEVQEQTEMLHQMNTVREEEQSAAKKVKVEFLKGEDGYTPVQGQDYMTQEEVAAFKRAVTPIKGTDYFDGEDGKDGQDGEDGKDGKSIKGDKGDKGDPGSKGEKGDKGDPGKDTTLAINDIIKEIRAKKLLDISDIKNWQSARKASGGFDMNDQRWHGGGGGGGSGAGATWIPLGVTTVTVGGIPAGTDLGLVDILIQDTLRQMLYPPNSPHVSLMTSPAGGLRETGDAITSVDLTPTTTAGSLPITSLTITGTDGFNYVYPTPNPAGGVEPTQTDSTGFSTNNSYTATVGDGTNTDTSTVTFTFASLYYYGVANAGLNIAADGGGLTKLLITNTATVAQLFSPTFPQVYYFAYPSAYPALTSILDKNGFETISDWTVSTVAVINSFGSVVNYRQYEFNNPTTQVNFQNTFKQ